MRTRKKKIMKEAISASSTGPLKYVAFVDAASYITRGNGLMTMLVGTGTGPEISKWYRKLSASEEYKSKAGEFKSLSSRFSTNPSLKTMYIALNKIKAKGQAAEDKTQIEKDMQLVIAKIGRIISSKLTDEDKELFETVSSYLDSIAGNLAGKLDSALTAPPPEEKPEETPTEEKPEEKGKEGEPAKAGETPAEKPADKPADKAAEKPAEKPAEKSAEKPAEKPEEEKPEEKPTEEPKKESVIREMMQKRIDKIVREILLSKIKK